MYLSVHGSTTYNSQDMEAPKCPLTDGWIKMWRIHTHTHTHTHNGILLSNKKMPSAATWMDLEIIIVSEVIERQPLCITYMQNLKKQYNELIHKRETDSPT